MYHYADNADTLCESVVDENIKLTLKAEKVNCKDCQRMMRAEVVLLGGYCPSIKCFKCGKGHDETDSPIVIVRKNGWEKAICGACLADKLGLK